MKTRMSCLIWIVIGLQWEIAAGATTYSWFYWAGYVISTVGFIGLLSLESPWGISGLWGVPKPDTADKGRDGEA